MQTGIYTGGTAAWDDELEELYARLSGRGSFRYDAAADPLYRGYAERAQLAGRLAMQDTMGRAAALTGGYGSSYGQAVGQREYDDYLRSLGEAMPQFYAMAQQRWQDEGEALKDRYELLYRRAGDERAAQEAERERAAAAEQTAWQRRQAEQSSAADADKAAWQRQQANYSALVALIQSAGYQPTDGELRAAGLSRAAADALLAAWQSRNEPRRVIYRTLAQTGPEETAPAQAPAQSAPSKTKSAATGGRQRVRMTK